METTTTSKRTININKPCYIIFSLISIIFIFRHDFSQASVFAGLALVFDPFNPQMSFQDRPMYQRAWLVVHLAVALVLFVLMFVPVAAISLK